MALKAIYDKQDEIEEQFRELYTERNGKWELTGIEGIKTQADVDRLQTALANERKEHKATKDKFAPFADKDLTKVLADLDRIPELEAAAEGNLDEDKMNELVDKRIRARIAPVERERDLLKGKVSEHEKALQTWGEKDRVRTIHDSVRASALKAKIVPEAIDDILMLSERVFDIVEGNVVVKDNVGFVPGNQVDDWFSEVQPKRPHWWPPSSGGGGAGNRGGGGGFTGDNPWTAEKWNMTRQNEIYKEDSKRADSMAKAAGTTVGGTKPPPRK